MASAMAGGSEESPDSEVQIARHVLELGTQYDSGDPSLTHASTLLTAQDIVL